MSKKKGLGKDINLSIKIMDELLVGLQKFHGMPLKKGLKSNKIDEDDISKVVNDALVKATALHTIVQDLRSDVAGVKPRASARFASQRVISNFLSMDDGIQIKVAAEEGKYTKMLVHPGEHVSKMNNLLEEWSEKSKDLAAAKRKWQSSDFPWDLDRILKGAKELSINVKIPQKTLDKFINAQFSAPSEVIEALDELEDWAEETLKHLVDEGRKKGIEF